MVEKDTGLGNVSLEKTKKVIEVISGKGKQEEVKKQNVKLSNLQNDKMTNRQIDNLTERNLYGIRIPLSDETIELLGKISREITNNREGGKEKRATKAFVIRGILKIILSLFKDGKINLNAIKTEGELAIRIQEAIKKQFTSFTK